MDIGFAGSLEPMSNSMNRRMAGLSKGVPVLEFGVCSKGTKRKPRILGFPYFETHPYVLSALCPATIRSFGWIFQTVVLLVVDYILHIYIYYINNITGLLIYSVNPEYC